ncbi:MAG: methyltransferase domain-containing protein [Tepidisphaeraceae bacterium]
MVAWLVANIRRRVYAHRARWTARHLARFIKPTDRVLDIGAGDCRLVVRLQKTVGCQVVPVDVEDFNVTDVPLTLFDGRRLPFPDDSFDVVLLIFVLHHAEDAKAILTEARRVCRRRVIVFEDVTSNFWDRFAFRTFHRWLAWSERISYPFREWKPAQWSELAGSLGFRVESIDILGRQLGAFSCRHVAFVWNKTASQNG